MESELKEISKKLNVLISLSLKSLHGKIDVENSKKQRVGNMVNYLANFELDAKEIAEILGSPVQSVRTLLTPKRRKLK